MGSGSKGGALSAVVAGLLTLAVTFSGALAQNEATTQAPAAISYEKDVKPIVDRKCSGCHVNGGHAGGLQMNSFDELMQGGDDGSVVALGDVSSSMVSKAIHYQDPDLKMPPENRGKLDDADIAVIDKWIKESTFAGVVPASSEAAVAAPAAAPAKRAAAKVVETSEPVAPVSPMAAAAQEQFFETKVRPILVNKCYPCHASAEKGGLRLDSRAGILAGGRDGDVVVPGHPELSVMSTAIHYTDAKLQMPPRGSLKPEEVAAIDEWIKQGMPWPARDMRPAGKKVTAADKNFWSYKAPVRPEVPRVDSKWAETDIDRFVLAKLDEKHLKVNGDADKRTLLRRVTYDLTGLPPTPAEEMAYMADKSPQAYEHVVDRLLASKAYGERWGRMWLDVVRYADTTGGPGDFPIPEAYKYRDYVIKAFNEDKPYNEFIKEQLAGDLLPAKSEPEHWEHVVATGYIAEASTYDGAQIEDAVDNVGYAFLGTTMACARCHDHKFDPIPTSDYYAMAGIFKSTSFPHAGDDGVRHQANFVYRDPKQLDTPEIKAFEQQLKPIEVAIKGVLGLPGTYDDLLPQLERRRMDLYARAPKFPESAYAVSDGDALQAQIMIHGDPTNLGPEVPRGTPQVLGGGTFAGDVKGSGRLQLAEWIASKDNPVTARVIVNRLWQGHFGRGIVSTPNDFGTRGVAPSDQPLLDYLATELVAKGWSLKAMQREIVLSHVYRLSTADDAANDATDPDNVYLWRHDRTRLDAEELRDSLLADAQMLDRSPAGPHPFPPQSKWNWEEQNPFAPNVKDYDDNRRTVYMMVQRTVKNQYMTLWDGADATASVGERNSSLTPLQALYLMNADLPRKCSDHLAELLVQGTPEKSEGHAQRVSENKAAAPNDKELVDRAFMVLYGRMPEKAEEERSAEFLHQVSMKYVVGGSSPVKAQQKALSGLVLAMFSSNEFMFVE